MAFRCNGSIKWRKNAGILAATIIGAFDETVGKKVEAYKKEA